MDPAVKFEVRLIVHFYVDTHTHSDTSRHTLSWGGQYFKQHNYCDSLNNGGLFVCVSVKVS